MNLQFEKSEQKIKKRKSLSTRWHELLDRSGKHFSTVFIGRLNNAHEVRLWVVEWALLVIVVFLFSIVQILWYNDAYEVDAYVAGGDYSEATLGKVNSLNPLYATTSSEKVLAKLLFANLASIDTSGHMKGELAESIKMDETGKVWTVTLRKNLYWSDGEPITADDIIFTINLIRNPIAKTTVATSFANIRMEKTDDRTVVFTLPSVYREFMDSLELPLLPSHLLSEVSPALVYESNFSMNPVGSGPFVINAIQASTSDEPNLQTIYLNRNDNYYWDDALLYSFTIKTYDNIDDIASALKNLDVQATAELGVEKARELPSNINRRTSNINGGAFAFINTSGGITSKTKVRQAIQRGVDMEKVRSDVIDDSRILDYPIVPEQIELQYPELPKYDVDEAKRLLTEELEAQYGEDGALLDGNGDRISIRVAVAKRDTITGVAERFVGELKNLGFEVILNVLDESQSSEDFFASVVRPRDYDILIYEVDLGVSADPFVYYSSTQISGGGWNFSNYNNGIVDDALLSAHTATSMTQKKTKYELFLRYWVNDVPAIGLYRSSLNYYYAQNVKIFSEDSRMTDALDRFADVEYWASEKRPVNLTP